jgi:hypothetical protein
MDSQEEVELDEGQSHYSYFSIDAWYVPHVHHVTNVHWDVETNQEHVDQVPTVLKVSFLFPRRLYLIEQKVYQSNEADKLQPNYNKEIS